MAHYLDGKFVIHSEIENDGESYRTGQVKATTESGAFIQFDRMGSGVAKDDWTWPIKFVLFVEFATPDDSDSAGWGFFETREALDAYLAYTEGPPSDDDARVLKLVPREPPKPK